MKWLSYIVISYMLLALVWWTILLHTKNREVYEAQVENLKITQHNTPETYEFLTKNYKRQANMILGEGMVFGVSLLIGIWLIQRSFARELETKEKQNNFLLSVTHELKSPLTTINLSLETLKKRKLEHDMVKEVSESALQESHRLERLINDLLLASKLDQKYQFSKEKIDLSTLVSETINRYKDRSEYFVFTDDVQENVHINGDGKSVEKILTNLIENAIKYGESSPIHISLSSDKQNGVAILKVCDEGPGVPLKERNNIFQKFYRIGSEQTRKTKGTGLGLYIVDRIAEGHGGSVSFHENQPKGSIFEVKLPLVS
ncbi:MAG: HAMP domain-containing histidine kinase [Saprospiraceae bacterium]|nr:HAMP domain-containing histidine kinase [Saprospiraceae bacterium]